MSRPSFPDLDLWNMSYETMNEHGRFRIKRLGRDQHVRWIGSQWDGDEWIFVTSAASPEQVVEALRTLIE